MLPTIRGHGGGDLGKGMGRRRRLRLGMGAPVPGRENSTQGDVDVGRRLRQIRGNADLSLRSLAARSGLAINTLCLIENGKTSPSVSTLQRLALALEVPITAFFETNAPKQSVAFLKGGDRTPVSFAHGAVEDLGAGLIHSSVEPLFVSLIPAADSGPSPIAHTGLEFVYCLSGRIEYCVEEQAYLLEPGDSLFFEAHLAHRWRNPEAEPAEALFVLCPSDEQDRLTERHFVRNGGDETET